MKLKTKKMNKIYGLNIDALRLCYEITDPHNIEIVRTSDIGEEVDFMYFYLRRIEGKHFKFVYEIRYNDAGINKLFGELRLGINDDKEENNRHTNGLSKAWISIDNRVLYSNEIYYLEFIENNLGLELHNITTLDLCLDLSNDIAQMIRKLIRNNKITTFLNGKEVLDRSQDRPEITYISSGNMDRDKYLTVCVKQKKAMKDKSRGSTLTAYNKKAEIANSSSKKYIEEFYGNPDKLYRLEVHLNNDEVKEYLNRTRQELSFYSLVDVKFLLRLFDQTLNSLIRFEHEGKKLDWDDLLLGVITTTPGNNFVPRLIHSKRARKVI